MNDHEPHAFSNSVFNWEEYLETQRLKYDQTPRSCFVLVNKSILPLLVKEGEEGYSHAQIKGLPPNYYFKGQDNVIMEPITPPNPALQKLLSDKGERLQSSVVFKPIKPNKCDPTKNIVLLPEGVYIDNSVTNTIPKRPIGEPLSHNKDNPNNPPLSTPEEDRSKMKKTRRKRRVQYNPDGTIMNSLTTIATNPAKHRIERMRRKF